MKISADLLEKKTFCSLLWHHVAVRSSGKVLPCCRFEDPKLMIRLANKNLDTVLKSDSFESIRASMLNDEKITGCKNCYDEEARGSSSLRTRSNQRLVEYNQSKNLKIELKSVELSFSNICNLACMGCHPSQSSKWSEMAATVGYDHVDLESLDIDWQKIDLTGVHRLKVVGGEPFLSKSFLQFCEAFKNKNQHMHVQLFTNVTIKPKKEYLDFLFNSKNFVLFLSIDGLEKENTYFRYYSNWNTIEENLQWYYSQMHLIHNCQLYISYTLQIFNIFNFIEFCKYIDTHYPKLEIFVNVLASPEWLNVRNLPEHVKNQLIKKLQNKLDDGSLLSHRFRPQFRQAIAALKEPQRLEFSSCVDKFEKIDAYRSTDWRQMVEGVDGFF